MSKHTVIRFEEAITKTHRGMIETFLGTIPPGDKEVEALILEGDSR